VTRAEKFKLQEEKEDNDYLPSFVTPVEEAGKEIAAAWGQLG
jgi:hypothetical protein